MKKAALWPGMIPMPSPGKGAPVVAPSAELDCELFRRLGCLLPLLLAAEAAAGCCGLGLLLLELSDCLVASCLGAWSLFWSSVRPRIFSRLATFINDSTSWLWTLTTPQ